MILLMLNLNQVIKLTLHYLKQNHKSRSIFLLLSTTVFLLYSCDFNAAFCQTSQTLPQEFQFLSINSRALEKTIDVTIDSLSSQNIQNIPLDKTGVLLHISTSPKIKEQHKNQVIFK